MKPAYAYMRCSGLGQVDGDTWDRQEEAILNYCRLNQFEVVEWFREEGVTGTVEDRPAMAEMMVALKENGKDVHHVIIEKCDRLARDLMVQEFIFRDLSQLGATTVSAVEGNLDGDDTRILIRQIMGAFAEYEKKMTVKKLAAARRRMRLRDGRCEGGKPYGSKKGEKPVCVQIEHLSGTGMSNRAVARHLNHQEVPTRRGGKWSHQLIGKVLAR